MITVYSYDKDGVYSGQGSAMENPKDPGTYLMPFRTTAVPPPTPTEGTTPRWIGNMNSGYWTLVDDPRGTWYDIYTQATRVIFDIDDTAPADHTREAPPAGQPTWQFTGTVWERTLESAKQEKYKELLFAYHEYIVTPVEYLGRNYRLDTGMITDIALLDICMTGQVDLVDADGEVGTINHNILRTLLGHLVNLRHTAQVNLALKRIVVDQATDIPTVDGVSW